MNGCDSGEAGTLFSPVQPVLHKVMWILLNHLPAQPLQWTPFFPPWKGQETKRGALPGGEDGVGLASPRPPVTGPQLPLLAHGICDIAP